MKKRLIILMTIVAMAAVVLAGCGAPAVELSVAGKWYDEKGAAGTIEFKEEGKCEIVVMGVTIDGDYTFDAKTGKGTITVTVEDEAQSSDFDVKDDKLTLEEVTYTMTEVEQMDLSDALNSVVDELGEGMEDLASDLGDLTDEIADDVQDALDDASETLADAAE